jgi:hypothetical protein
VLPLSAAAAGSGGSPCGGGNEAPADAEAAAAARAAAAAALQERAQARFGARDFEGAAEAFGALAALHRQGGSSGGAPGDPAELARALGNRAACWLPLERYAQCRDDCLDALGAWVAVFAPAAAAAVTAGGGEGGSGGAPTLPAAAERVVAAVEAAIPRVQAGDGVDDEHMNGAAAEAADSSAADQAGLRKHAGAAARLAARAALVSACLKRAEEAGALYKAARALHAWIGEEQRTRELQEDEERLLQGAA